jgi:DNA-binding transcriptional regulator YdaS (Cro superfamily)
MTPVELRAICNVLNDDRNTGGQTRLARLLGCDPSTIRRKLSGKSKISRADELAITKVVESLAVGRARRRRSRI